MQTIKSLRKKANLTQKEAARITNVPLRTFKEYENNSEKVGNLKYNQIVLILNDYIKSIHFNADSKKTGHKHVYSTEQLSWVIRRHVLEMISVSHSSHIGSSLSEVEILSILYNEFLNFDSKNINDPDRDYFILSKGHASAALYAVLAEFGFFPVEDLLTFDQDNSKLSGHVTTKVPGIEISTGSLGHGLGVASGLAYSLKKNNKNNKVYVLLGDGECDEGSIYEALNLSSQLKLDNLVILVDINKMSALGFTKNIVNLEPLTEKFTSFNIDTYRVDGNNLNELRGALMSIDFNNEKPHAILCDTVKGKGISFMENDILWHYRFPHQDNDEYSNSLKELKSIQPKGVKDPYES